MSLRSAYVVSLLAVAIAVAVRLLLDPLLNDSVLFSTVYFAVGFATWYGGRSSGLLALVTGAVAGNFFLLPPRYSFEIARSEHFIGLVLYGVAGLATIAMFESLRNAARKANDQRQELEQEVAAHRATRESSAQQAEQLRTTLASIGDAVITTDIDARITYLNAVAESLTGWTAADATGQRLDDVFRIVNETSRTTVESPVARALQQGVIVGLANHTVLLSRDGTERPIDDSAAPIRRTDGEVVGCVLVFRDISERHRQKVELEERERQFRTLAESIPQLAWMSNADGFIFWYNRRWYEYTGTTPQQMEGWGWQTVHDPDQLPEVLERWKACIAAGTPFEMTFPLKAHDGQCRSFLTRVEPVKDEEGRVVRWFGTNTDITALKTAEDQLRLNEQFNRSLMDGTADCVKVLDTDGRLLHMNAPGMCAMEIDDFEPLRGRDWRSTWPTDSQSDVVRSVTMAVDGKVSSFEAFCPTAKGTPKWWEVTVSPVRDIDGGQVVRLLAVSRDITAQRERNERERASEAEFRAIFEQSVVGMAQSSATTQRFVRVNSQFCDITGYTATELAEMTPADLTLSEDRDGDANAIGRLLRGEVQSYDQEKRYLRKDETIVWVHETATLLRNADGRPERTMAVIRDISDRKTAESDRIRLLQQVEGERARLADVFRHAPAFMCVLRGPDHVYELVNERYNELVGRRDVLGRTVLDALPEVVEQGFVALLDKVYATGESVVGTSVLVLLARQADQPLEERYLDLVYQALRDPSGAVTGIVIVGVDVTDRNRAEAAVRSSEVKYRSLFETMDEGFCVIDVIFNGSGAGVDYRFVETNPAFEKHTGLVEAVGRTMREFVPDLESHWFETYGRVVQTGEPVRFVDVAEAMERRWFEVYAFRLDVAGSNKVAVLFSDITAGQRAEAALRESEERYRIAISAVSDVVWTNNADGLMAGEQQGWEEFTGQSREEYQGFGWSKAIHPEDTLSTIEEWARAVAEKRTFLLEHRVRRRDGKWRVCSVRAVPILDDDGMIREWVGVHTDVTEKTRASEELRQLTAELSEADRRKDEFLATLAHELRNPLAPIRNGLEVMKLAGGTDVTIDRTRRMMERQLAQMVRLVDDLMDVGRITQDKLELRKERLPLVTVLNSAVDSIRPLVDQMGHRLTVTFPNQPVIVDADMTRLSQVFVNLLTNAAKYGERGGHIRMSVERDASDVLVRVKDTGIGIAADQLHRIFDMFTQVNQSSEKSQGGLGIGLTLVKRLVELHGGTVEARSEGKGKGSEFVVKLPVVSEDSKSQTSNVDQERSATSSLRILIVDDNQDGADSLAMMLRIVGNDTRTSYDGQAGVDEAEAFRPEVILFDIGMPRMNGYEACRYIREQSWGASVVIIALTGMGKELDRRRSHDAGFDHHLVKPVEPRTLLNLLAGLQAAKQ